MTTKTYGQYCGVARALELVGERWALLIVRDLLVGPKRYTDLRSGLPKIPTNVLATRLKELESAGLVERHVQPRPSGAIVYQLTPYGLDLEPVVLALGRWGARSLGELRPGEIATADSLVMALRSTYHPPKRGTGKLAYELRFGDIVVHALCSGPTLTAAPGPFPEPAPADLVVVEAMAPLTPLLTGAIDGAKARADGVVGKQASAANLDLFATIFQIN
ncbi:winged helix-turn-helix transcriptional regulator [Kribbella sp. NBC_00359]|uniref:winged helix-turn-helix transcriptional regulator n=1 Tax=Kribbella sp. NBC_00359 TaxID=2975966 RepID=UPI002E1AD304